MHLSEHEIRAYSRGPESIEAGAPEVTSAQLAEMEDAFLDWYGLNSGIIIIINDGGVGDIRSLFHSLEMAFAKAMISSADAPRALK